MSNTYSDLKPENNNKDPKFKVDDYVIISVYKNTFGKCYTKNYLLEKLSIEKVKIVVPVTYEIENGE